MNCQFCPEKIKYSLSFTRQVCNKCNVEYYFDNYRDLKSWYFLVLYKDTEYHCRHMVDESIDYIYTCHYIDTNLILTLKNVNITPFNFVSKLPTMLTFG